MTTNNGDSGPQTFMTFNVQLETCEKMIYRADGFITREEAGKRIRAKFGRGGRFIK